MTLGLELGALDLRVGAGSKMELISVVRVAFKIGLYGSGPEILGTNYS